MYLLETVGVRAQSHPKVLLEARRNHGASGKKLIAIAV